MPDRFVLRGRQALLVGLGATLLIGSTGCTPTASGGSTAQPAPSASSSGAGSSDVAPRTDLRDVQRVEWSRYEQVGDSSVRVHFLMRDPRCFGVRADVSATDAAVQITVLEGTVPGAPDNCTMDAAETSLLVTLQNPLGGRPVTQP